jgi:epoxyqueuosine reductase
MINKNEFNKNSSRFLEHAIKDFVSTSPANRLAAFDNEYIFDEPLVGFADGDDNIFQDYKKIIGEFHQTPREALEMGAWEHGDISVGQPENVSVISFIMPASMETKRSMRNESTIPSLRWNHTRWRGQAFIFTLSCYLVSLLEKFGYRAVAPEMMHNFKTREREKGYASNWSQRHIAYAAGLGTFSLNDGFITPKGIAMRCGSVVTDLKLTPGPRPYENHLANCLFYHNGSCRRCVERCPAGAITQQGHDRKKCREFMHEQMAEIQKDGIGQGYIGTYAGCGLCQTGVPCESAIPVSRNG